MTARRTWAVQMLLVALSRRICCSRVCKARRYARRPSASYETPTRRPGMWRFRACLDNANRLRMTIEGDEERFSIRCDRVAKRHRFSGGRGFIQQRRVRDIKRGQVRDHLLEIEQRLQPALRYLSLVRCVCTIPTGVLKNVSLNDGRRNVIGLAGPVE